MLAIRAWGQSYESVNPYDQLTINDLSLEICAGDASLIPMFVEYGIFTYDDLKNVMNIEYYCLEPNTLSSNYLTKIGIDKENVLKIEFLNSNNFDSSGLTSVDVSQKGDESILGYFNENNGTLSIVSDNKIKFPQYSAYLFSGITTIEFNNYIDTSNVVTMAFMFWNSGLTELDLSSFDTSNVTTMNSMFSSEGSEYNSKLKKIKGLENFNTSNVTNMSDMFFKCSSLEELDLSSFDTSQVTDMSGMFGGCSSLQTLDLSNFNTSNVTTMNGMFVSCASLQTLDVSSFNTSKVTNMRTMFDGSSSIQTLDLSSFDMSKVENTLYMFYQCPSLTSILARTEADKEAFDSSDLKPETAIVTVK